jgi:hypothetical protein
MAEMKKVAACLFVRNEADDIASWLAWYHLLGFDTCIVYDDHSTDGTWEVLCAAGRVQDIRLARARGDATSFHAHRQSGCYLDAIERYAKEFEWIGFFDADEYLRLRNSPTIQDFLDRFPDAGSIGTNWCCYGSSGHALKPSLSPIEAYTWHGSEALPINRHVKTLLRLSCWQGKYFNPHYFDVAPGKALNPAGQVIRWSATPGIIEGPPDWSVAKVMHYQCRSMEHFLERLRRIPTLQRTTSLWYAYDVANVEDTSPQVFAPALNAQIARYNLGIHSAKARLQKPSETAADALADGESDRYHTTRSSAPPASERPMVHVTRLGRLGNHMIQYMTALKLASQLGDCGIAGIDLPEWGIRLPVMPVGERSIVMTEEGRTENVTHGHLDFDHIEQLVRSNTHDSVHLQTYSQNIGNFLPREFYNNVFISGEQHIRGYGEETLLCNLRGGDILNGVHRDYVLLPVDYYKYLVETTGLTPVFFGEISDNCYIDELRHAFPTAAFVAGTNPIVDFETIRRSRNIAICVSTFSWLAAWLSQADRIFMPLTGLFNPFQHPRSYFAPVRDPRYVFHLFPINRSVPVENISAAHAPLRGNWRAISGDDLEHRVQTAPRHERDLARAVAVFDESFYLNHYPDVRQAVARGGLKSGLDHFIRFGFIEHRDPLFVDPAWYIHTYPQAAVELGQGDYEDPVQHYAEVGALQGFAPRQPTESSQDHP